jgi:hypothetical protein
MIVLERFNLSWLEAQPSGDLSPPVSYLGVDPEFSFDSIFILPLYQINN